LLFAPVPSGNQIRLVILLESVDAHGQRRISVKPVASSAPLARPPPTSGPGLREKEIGDGGQPAAPAGADRRGPKHSEQYLTEMAELTDRRPRESGRRLSQSAGKRWIGRRGSGPGRRAPLQDHGRWLSPVNDVSGALAVIHTEYGDQATLLRATVLEIEKRAPA
jgi:hypothetical protein